ncbi:hypothetical protein QT972_16565 [Microcoleus sp. herbarium7]|uniref:hypothetical protein n=1 Tax=Microcoleus sp. herbarium7 TaxID=3055435 RepID=UPI002FCF533F
MINHICPNCKIHNTDYFPEFEFYGCNECGHAWGGVLNGKQLNKAWYAVQKSFREKIRTDRIKGSFDPQTNDAYEIAFNNLDAIASALDCNQKIKDLPNNPQWWIQNQSDIETELLAIGET